MKIAISGAQSVGKTTLIEALTQDDRFKGFQVRGEITRTLQKQGLPINEEATLDTQLLILNEHIRNLLLFPKESIILDRCLLDGIVYTKYFLSQEHLAFQEHARWLDVYISSIADRYLPRYDYIFYIDPEFDIEDDGVRSTSVVFRDTILSLFEQYIEVYKAPIIKVTGSVQRRVEMIADILYKV